MKHCPEAHCFVYRADDSADQFCPRHGHALERFQRCAGCGNDTVINTDVFCSRCGRRVLPPYHESSVLDDKERH